VSTEEKQKIGDIFTWIMRGLTGVGAFFLIQTYGLMTETNSMLQKHMLQYASERMDVQVRLGVAEKELERYRNEKDQRTHYYYNPQNQQTP
jgi:hypothetical protein